MIWLDSIFCSLAMWVAEKMLRRKIVEERSAVASDVSTNTARDETLRSVVFVLTSMHFGFGGRNISAGSTLQNLFSLALHSIFSK